MSGLSDPALAALIEAGQKLRESDLTTMLMRAGIYEYSPRKTGFEREHKAELIRSRVIAARAAAEEGDPAAHRGLLAFAAEVVQRTVTNPEKPPPWLGELRDTLLADGYDLTWGGTPPRISSFDSTTWRKTPSTIRYKILPTDAAPVPLSTEISALEAELAARGYTTALNHYRQAVEGFTNHKFESANADLRSALEDLVTHLAEDHTGYQRTTRASQGGAAIRHIVEGGYLPEDDGGAFLDGLWKLTHTNGSHPGMSDGDEARFRMQAITATSRFLLKRFPS